MILMLFGVACASRTELSSAYATLAVADGTPPCLQRTAADECTLYDASLIQLIARPELYDGKRVLVTGFANLEFERNALYLSKELYENGSSRDAVWLDVEGIRARSVIRRGYVLIEGTFSAGPSGHFAMFSGAISNISRFEARRSRWLGAYNAAAAAIEPRARRRRFRRT